MRRSLVRWLLFVLVLLLLGFSYYLRHGGWMAHFDSRYKEANLLGLTVAEVEAKLGAPDYDPRKPWPWKGNPPANAKLGPPQWRDERDGRLSIAYHQGWAISTIWFEDGRVVSVKHLWK
jgi:hypothetical protein